MGFEPSCAYLEKYRKDGVWRSVVCVSCLARAQLDNETSKSKSIRVRSTISARSNSRPLTSENSMCRSQTRELSSNPSGFLALASTVECGVDILQPSRGWGDRMEGQCERVYSIQQAERHGRILWKEQILQLSKNIRVRRCRRR